MMSGRRIPSCLGVVLVVIALAACASGAQPADAPAAASPAAASPATAAASPAAASPATAAVSPGPALSPAASPRPTLPPELVGTWTGKVSELEGYFGPLTGEDAQEATLTMTDCVRQDEQWKRPTEEERCGTIVLGKDFPGTGKAYTSGYATIPAEGASFECTDEVSWVGMRDGDLEFLSHESECLPASLGSVLSRWRIVLDPATDTLLVKVYQGEVDQFDGEGTLRRADAAQPAGG